MAFKVFSERNKIKVGTLLQKDSIDNPLKNALWSYFYKVYYKPMEIAYFEGEHGKYRREEYYRFLAYCCEEFWDKRTNHIHGNIFELIKEIEKEYDKLKWDEIYDFFQMLIFLEHPELPSDKIINDLNNILKKHTSAYRIVGNTIIEITDDNQISSIENALRETSTIKLQGAKLHLETALKFLSNKDNPDYRNSIKESISAVESVCVLISNEQENTLGKALHAIEGKINLPKTLKEGFGKLYNWTSDKSSGIRHFMLDDPNLDSEDAIYMLVSCSAFISFLIVKANKAGVDFSK